MKNTLFKALFTLFAAFIFSYGFSQNIDHQQGELSIMSYNIHHANPPSQKDTIDLDAIVEVIRSKNPDLVALQEIDADTKRSGPGNQAEHIGKALNMHVFFGKSIDFEGGAYGLAILSKYPLKNTKIHRLPSQKDTEGEPRILATAAVSLPDGTLINFGSTHLDAQRDDVNRILQIREIENIYKENSLPAVIAGDFNAVYTSEIIKILDRQFTRTCQHCPPTIPVKNPQKAIDFIAFKGQSYFTIKTHEVLENTFASDHLPVFAILQY